MEHLNINHLKGYLGTGLKVKTGKGKIIRTLVVQIVELFEVDSSILINTVLQGLGHMPILFPLSFLTKEITVNRSVITPIIELAKIATNVFDLAENNKIFINKQLNQLEITGKKGARCIFAFDKSDNSFIMLMNGKTVSCNRQLELFEKLYEWHFDIHGLIEKGLAIDVNTLPDNPYK